MNKLVSILVLAVLFLTACSNPQGQVEKYQKTIDSLQAIIAMDHSSETAAILKADSDWSAVSQTNSVEGWLKFYTPDAIIMPPNDKMQMDKATVDKSTKEMFAIPGFNLKWQSKAAGMSRSGDLGYTVGEYQWKSKDAKGKDYNETGNYTEIWKKQPDGSWKCIVDMWHSNMPAAQ